MMKKVTTLSLLPFLCLLVAASLLYASNPVSIHGSVEWDLSINKPKDTVLNLEGTRLEEVKNSVWCFLNPEISASDTFQFSSKVRLQKPFIPNTKATLYLDEAYFNYYLSPHVSVLGGKKRLPWGYSYLWNPSLILNPQKYIFEPERYREGFPVLALGYTGTVMSPKLFWAAKSADDEELKLEDSYLGFQIDGYFSGLELFLNGLASDQKEKSIGWGMRKDIFGFIVHLEGSVVKNSQRRYFYDPHGLEEGDPIYYSQNKRWQPLLTVGFNRILSADTFLIFEYFYDRAGFQAREFDNFVKSLNFFTDRNAEDGDDYYTESFSQSLEGYTPGSIRQNYAYLAYSHRLKRDWNPGLRTLVSLDDGSGFIYPFISFSAITNSLIELEACVPFSRDPDSEFGLLPLDWSTTLKIKIFF